MPFGQVHASWQIVSLLSSLGILKRPTGQSEQELASINVPVLSDDDMYLLAGQQPYLALPVLVPRLLNAFLSPVKPFTGSHLLPHNVRSNPLFRKMRAIVVQLKVTQFERSLLNADAPLNVDSMVVTPDTAHFERSLLNADAL